MSAQTASQEEKDEEFLACARYGELDEMLAELANGAEVNARGPGGQTALHMACANGHEAIVKALLERGADAGAANDNGNTPGHYAAQRGQAACLKLCLEGQDALRRNNFGKSIVTEAIASGDGATATAALEHESASEEKMVAGLNVQDDAQEVTHALKFSDSTPVVRCREKPIAKEGDSPLGDGSGATDRTGLGVWAAALVLGRWLAAEGPGALDETKVVELGAGCGVGTLALAAAVATCKVVATDCFAETLENLRHNVSLFAEDHGNPKAEGPLGAETRVASCALDWADPGSSTCDVVVGADLVYAEAAVAPLTRAVDALSPREVWYAAPETGRAGGEKLLTALEELGYSRSSKPAPAAYSANPLAGSGEDAAHLAYFPDLATQGFVLHRFVKTR